MVDDSNEIIPRRKGRHDPDLGRCAVMVAMKRDLRLLQKGRGDQARSVGRLFSSKVYRITENELDVGVVGPVLGAPHAVMVLERLGAIGVKQVVFWGWCGAVAPDVHIGHIIVPDCGVIGEGTSGYYMQNGCSRPSRWLTGLIEASAVREGRSVRRGAVWSTDAPYRETRDRVRSLNEDGVLAVDMEVSALFSAGRFRDISVGALLVVSDELGSSTWVPGFTRDEFEKARHMVVRIVERTCRKMM